MLLLVVDRSALLSVKERFLGFEAGLAGLGLAILVARWAGVVLAFGLVPAVRGWRVGE